MTARVGSAPDYIELFITLSAFYNVSWVGQGAYYLIRLWVGDLILLISSKSMRYAGVVYVLEDPSTGQGYYSLLHLRSNYYVGR